MASANTAIITPNRSTRCSGESNTSGFVYSTTEIEFPPFHCRPTSNP